MNMGKRTSSASNVSNSVPIPMRKDQFQLNRLRKAIPSSSRELLTRISEKNKRYHARIREHVKDAVSCRAVLDEMKQNQEIITSYEYNGALIACVQSSNISMALDILQEMKDSSIMNPFAKPITNTYSTIMTALKRNPRYYQHILELFEEMKSLNIVPDVWCFTVAIEVCGKLKNVSKAAELFNMMKFYRVQPSLVTYNVMISIFGNAKQLDEALGILELLEGPTTNIRPDIFSYNAALNACEKNGAWKKALELLSTMERRSGVKPDMISHSTAISACGKAAQWEKALEVFKSAVRNKLKISITAVNALITAFEKGRQWRRAIDLFNSVESYGLKRDIITFNAVISACEKGGEWERAMNIFKMIEPAGLMPTIVSFNAVMSACEKGGQDQMALDILNKMERADIKPDIVSYNAVISACEKAYNWKKALEIFNMIEGRCLQPDIVSYNAAISACEKGGQWQTAIKLLNQMKQVKIEPDDVSYSAAISACEKGGQWQEGLTLLQSIIDRGKKPHVYSFNSVMTACEHAGLWEKSIEIFNSMDKYQVEKSSVSYNVVIGAYCRAGKFPEALNLFHRALELDKADQATVAILLQFLEIHNQSYRTGLDLIDTGLRVGILQSPWLSTYMVDFHGYSAAEARTFMRRHFESLLRRISSGEKPQSSSSVNIKNTEEPLVVIVGRGSGSEGNNPVLPGALKQFFSEYDMKMEDYPGNPGRFIVANISSILKTKFASTIQHNDWETFHSCETTQSTGAALPPSTIKTSKPTDVKVTEFPSRLVPSLIDLAIESKNAGVDKLIDIFLEKHNVTISRCAVRNKIKQCLVKEYDVPSMKGSKKVWKLRGEV